MGKRNILTAISLFAVMVVALVVLQNADFQNDNSGKEYTYANSKRLNKFLFEQKVERKSKSKPKPDKPDEAMLEEISLRSEIGKPFSYTGSWKIEAFNSAKKLSSNRLQKISGYQWKEHGPGNIGGRSRSVVVHPDSNNIWWVGAVGGGIWKTDNSGELWISQSDNMPIISITTIDICKAQPDILYAGTGEGFYNQDAIIGDGIFKTTNGGVTWEQLQSTISESDFRYVNRIIVHPLHADTLLAATNSGLFRSLDGGNSWKKIFTESGRVQQIIANPKNFNTQFKTICGKGIYKSVNMGAKWRKVSGQVSNHGRIEIAIAEADTNYLYATFVGDESRLKGFYQSKDAGESWTYLGNEPNWLGGQGWYNNTLAVHPFDPKTVFVGGIDLYRVTVNDGSMNARAISHWWGKDGMPYVHADQHFLVTIPLGGSNFSIISANDGGIFYSPNRGYSWSGKNNNYNVTQYYDGDRHPSLNRFIGGTQDNGTNVSPYNPGSSSSWNQVIGGDGFDCAWSKTEPHIVYGTLYDSRIYKSTNGGYDYNEINGETLPVDEAVFHTPLTMDPHDSDKLFTISGSNRIYYTENSGASWKGVNASFNGSRRVKISVSENDPGIVWAASSSGCINVSTDGGRQFRKRTRPSGSPNATVTGIATYPNEANSVLVMFGVSGYGKIFRTRNLGSSWKNITADLPNVPVHCAVVMPYDSSEIWIGTDIGLFISHDDGQSWQYENNGLPAVSIRRLKIVGKKIIAATHGRGIWSIQNDNIPDILAAPNKLTAVCVSSSQIDLTWKNNADDQDGLYLEMSENGGFFSRIDTLDANAVSYSDTGLASFTTYTYRLRAYKGSITSLYSNKASATPGPGGCYDMGTATSPVKDDFLSVDETTTSGPYRWLDCSSLNSRDRKSGDALVRDLIFSSDPATFEVEVENKTYEVVVTMGDASYLHDDMVVKAEGLIVASDIDRAAGTIEDVIFEVEVTDGILSLEFSDGGGTDEHWVVNGVILIPLDDNTHIAQTATTTPAEFALDQNYPNPFNPSTVIKYHVETLYTSSLHVELKIYDMLGREVAVLVNERKSAGNYTVEWNAKNFPSGVYFYRLSTEAYTEVKKCMLLK